MGPDVGNNFACIAVWRPRTLARGAGLILITGTTGDLARVAVASPAKVPQRSLNDWVVKIWRSSGLFWRNARHITA